MPPVLGYLLAGVIVGPFTFAGINFGPFTDLRGPVQNLGTIRLLADLGLVFLLFGIGLEIGWQRIRQIGLRVIIIGFVEMTTMFVLGYEIAYLLGWTPLEQVFLGAALSISSSAILIKMLRDTGTLFDPQGRIIVGVLLVEDFVAVIMLTVLSGIATTGGANIGDIGALAAKLAIFGTAALAFGALLAPRLIRYIARFESEEVTLITSLALCFSLALAGYELGLSAAAGGFCDWDGSGRYRAFGRYQPGNEPAAGHVRRPLLRIHWNADGYFHRRRIPGAGVDYLGGVHSGQGGVGYHRSDFVGARRANLFARGYEYAANRGVFPGDD